MKHEGPTNITSTSRTCGLCKFHRQHMIRSGENPWYKHFCGHPASSQGVKYSSFLFPDEHGREIGDTDNTPDWCPVVSERLSRKDEPQRGSAKFYETVDAIRADFPTGAILTLWEEPHVVTGHRLTRTYKMPQIQVYAVSDRDKRRIWMWVPNIDARQGGRA